MKLKAFFLIRFLSLIGFAYAGEEITVTGTVKQPGGKPLSAATVSIDPGNIILTTDEEGSFSTTLRSGSYSIVVEASGYEVRGETLNTGAKESLHLDFVMHPRNLQFEEIVIGEGQGDPVVSVSSPTSTVNPSKQAKTTSVLAAVTDIPGVAPLGQGGLFQVPSIRGAARERTILMLESVRVTSERRTGPSFSFVDPLFLESIHVTRGPAPVLYGSNGEAGLIQANILEPSAGQLTTFRTGYLSNSGENWQTLTFKDGSDTFQYAMGAARRQGGDFTSGDDQEFSGNYMRVNVFGKGRWITDAGALTFLVMPTWTDDIEKSSSDALTRPTLYPEERHQVYVVDWQNAQPENTYNYQIQTWLHPNSLITRDERVTNGVITSRNVVFNDTDDYGVRFRVGRGIFDTWRFWTGVDFFQRANVNASQDSFVPSPDGGFELTDSFFSIKDGSYTDTGLFLTGNGTVGKLIINTGLRVQRVNVSNNAAEEISNSENNWSGNVGVSLPFTSHWEGLINLGRGIRPATISEKFFTGETGRGSITGNPNLVTESNIGVDGGVRFRHGRGFAGFYLFRNGIDDFIARVTINGDAFTYLNLPEVTISGIEGEGYYAWDDFRLYGNFHVIQGHDAADADVNDIPPSRMLAGFEYQPQGSRLSGSLELVRQFEKSDPGPDELLREAAFVVNAKVQVDITGNFKFRLEALNLGNETYFDSADNRAPLAIGRSIGVELLTEF